MTANELRAERKALELAIAEQVRAFESKTGFVVKAIRLETHGLRKFQAWGQPVRHNVECEISLG